MGLRGRHGLLAEHFHVHAVDLRGQGRSTWTPGRYTLDNFGNDLVRFIDLVIGRPTLVSGCPPAGCCRPGSLRSPSPARSGPRCGRTRAVRLRDHPAIGQGIGQGIGPVFATWNKWLGDQWSIGAWDGLMRAMPTELPLEILRSLAAMIPPDETADPTVPPQNLREYDPEWGRAFVSGTATASCDHASMLARVRVPVLYTHHFRTVDPGTGRLIGAPRTSRPVAPASL